MKKLPKTAAAENYYATLGVQPDASPTTIKKAYRQLAQNHHPDVADNKKEAEEQFKCINAAYEVLGDPNLRNAYDQLRAAKAQRNPTPPPPPKRNPWEPRRPKKKETPSEPVWTCWPNGGTFHNPIKLQIDGSQPQAYSVNEGKTWIPVTPGENKIVVDGLRGGQGKIKIKLKDSTGNISTAETGQFEFTVAKPRSARTQDGQYNITCETQGAYLCYTDRQWQIEPPPGSGEPLARLGNTADGHPIYTLRAPRTLKIWASKRGYKSSSLELNEIGPKTDQIKHHQRKIVYLGMAIVASQPAGWTIGHALDLPNWACWISCISILILGGAAAKHELYQLKKRK